MKEVAGRIEEKRPNEIPNIPTEEKIPLSPEVQEKYNKLTGAEIAPEVRNPKEVPQGSIKPELSPEAQQKLEELGLWKVPICDDKPKGIPVNEKTHIYCDDTGKPYRTEDGGWISNNTFELDGHEFETDDYGSIYSIDGELEPNDIFILDGMVYVTDDNGKIISVEKHKMNNNLNEHKDVGDNQPIKNKIDGMAREEEVAKELEEKYPESEGYEILSEVYLRDKDGNIVRDPETGEARRIDFVVVKDGKVVDSVEVTSKTADKTVQSAKENRIREAGGNYVRDNNGNLVEIPPDVTTRVERRD